MQKDNLMFLPTNFRNYLGDNVLRYPTNDDYISNYSGIEKDVVYNNLNASKWFSGYVPSVHNSFLKFSISDIIVSRLVDKCVPFTLNGSNEEVSKFTSNLTEVDVEALIQKIFTCKMAYGSCLAKINKVDGLYTIEVIPLGRFNVLKKNAKGIEVVETYIDMFNCTDKIQETIIERRYYRNIQEGSVLIKKPFLRYLIKRNSFEYGKRIRSDYIDGNAVDEETYNNIKEWGYDLRHEYELDGTTIGAVIFNNDLFNKIYLDSKYGVSSFVGAGDLLCALDHAFTLKENDKYLGRGRVIVPKPMQSSVGSISSVNSVINSIGNNLSVGGFGARTVLDNTFYNEIPSNTLNDVMKPTSVQFNLRTLEWRTEIEGLIGDIALHFGITSAMLDTRLVGSGQKTDDQITAEEDLTTATIEGHRKTINKPLEILFNMLNELFGSNGVFVEWSKVGQGNYNKLSSAVISEYQSGLCSKMTALERLHPDWDNARINLELFRIKEETDLNVNSNFEAFGNE